MEKAFDDELLDALIDFRAAMTADIPVGPAYQDWLHAARNARDKADSVIRKATAGREVVNESILEKMAHAAYISIREKRYEDAVGYKLDAWPNTEMSIDADGFRAAAKAALLAIRNPTPETAHSGDVEDLGDATAREHWLAMIDHILGGGK